MENASGDYSGLALNGEAISGQSICYQVEYKTSLAEDVAYYGKGDGGADIFLDWLCSHTKALSVLPRTHISK